MTIMTNSEVLSVDTSGAGVKAKVKTANRRSNPGSRCYY